MSTANPFGHVHPAYKRMYQRWVMARDFFRGGLSVLKPEAYETSTRTLMPSYTAAATGATGASPEGEDAGGYKGPNWTHGTSRSYLFKNPRELDPDYEERNNRAVHWPVFKPLVNIFSAGVLRVGPTRDGVSTSWKEWLRNVDGAGTDYNAFIRLSLAKSLVFGRYHALPDRPRYDRSAASRLHQRYRGERAYLTGLSPLAIEDWETDSRGELIWFRVTEPDIRPRSPLEERKDNPVQYRIWYRDHWELYQATVDDKGKITGWGVADAGELNMDRPNLITLWANQGDGWDCDSPLSDSLDVDREIFNLYSQLGVLEDIQAFAMLYLPVEEGGSMGPIDVGAATALTGPIGGDPKYISPGSEMANAKWKRIQERVHLIRQQTGVGRGRAEYSKEERSGESILRETEDKVTLLSGLAGATEEYDQGCLDLVAQWEGGTMSSPPISSYPRNFDLKGIQAQINELLQLKSTDAAPHAIMVELAKPVVGAILTEKGVDRKKIDEVMKAMDEAAKEPPPTVQPPILSGPQDDASEDD